MTTTITRCDHPGVWIVNNSEDHMTCPLGHPIAPGVEHRFAPIETMTTTTQDPFVIAGARELTSRCGPAWVWEVELESLDPGDDRRCVLAQLEQSRFADSIRGLSKYDTELGFCPRVTAEQDPPDVDEEWAFRDQCRDAWLTEITERRDHHLANPVAGVDYDPAEPTFCDMCQTEIGRTVYEGGVYCRRCCAAEVDRTTLNKMAEMLAVGCDGPDHEWPGASGLEDLAAMVKSTGRSLDASDYPDAEPWEAH